MTGSDVVVSGSGRLGVVVSSARYKRDIRDMAGTTDHLMKLRPVTFRYKSDPDSVTQYGLVAEEVARVYPELVVRDSQGQVESVRYSMLSAMLLNELQKQTRENRQQSEKVAQLEARLSKLEQSIALIAQRRDLAAAFNK